MLDVTSVLFALLAILALFLLVVAAVYLGVRLAGRRSAPREALDRT